MDAIILKTLREYRDIYELLGDDYRARAYNKAIIAHKAGHEVTAGIAKKIAAIRQHQRLDDLEELRKSPYVSAARELGSILGVGPETVSEWYRRGITTRTQLRAAIREGKLKLNHMQAIGLKYYVQLHRRIPRADITEFEVVFRNHVREIYPRAHVIAAGSYRRMAEDSGDIDLLIYDETRPDIGSILEKFPPVVVVVAGKEKTSALYRINGVIRHVDIISVRANMAAAALLYLTGSAEFNEQMRGHAKMLGFRLNQHGLFKDGVVVPMKTERDIFSKLSMKYITPRYR